MAWHDYRHAIVGDTANVDIYCYDLSTAQKTPVKAGYRRKPYLYGNTVVWFDCADNTIDKATISASAVAVRYTGPVAATSRPARGGAAQL